MQDQSETSKQGTRCTHWGTRCVLALKLAIVLK